MSFKSAAGFKKQQGLGYTGYLLIMSVAIFMGMFAFKVGPNYFEHWTVEKVVEDLAEQPDVLKQPKSQVYAHINRAYRQNNLWDLKAEETVKLTRDAKRGYIIEVKYEKRDQLFHNIDVVTSFDSTVNGDAAMASE